VAKAKRGVFAVVLQWLDSIFAAPVRQGGEQAAFHALPQSIPKWKRRAQRLCGAVALYGSGANGLL
jgi:hypothetical protein